MLRVDLKSFNAMVIKHSPRPTVFAWRYFWPLELFGSRWLFCADIRHRATNKRGDPQRYLGRINVHVLILRFII